jgi:hypothetical protein
MTTMYYRERRCFQIYGIMLFVRFSCRVIERLKYSIKGDSIFALVSISKYETEL